MWYLLVAFISLIVGAINLSYKKVYGVSYFKFLKECIVAYIKLVFYEYIIKNEIGAIKAMMGFWAFVRDIQYYGRLWDEVNETEKEMADLQLQLNELSKAKES